MFWITEIFEKGLHIVFVSTETTYGSLLIGLIEKLNEMKGFQQLRGWFKQNEEITSVSKK